jgi:ABC-type Fe3+/spermidine/putrescine transport system ATPase subunit
VARELGVTTIHITHNQVEAEELADRIAVMISGRIAQAGKSEDILFRPENEAVSNFVGSLNILDCSGCQQLVPGLMEVDCGGINVVLAHDEEGGYMADLRTSPRLHNVEWDET